jgi:hypothetical protein
VQLYLPLAAPLLCLSHSPLDSIEVPAQSTKQSTFLAQFPPFCLHLLYSLAFRDDSPCLNRLWRSLSRLYPSLLLDALRRPCAISLQRLHCCVCHVWRSGHWFRREIRLRVSAPADCSIRLCSAKSLCVGYLLKEIILLHCFSVGSTKRQKKRFGTYLIFCSIFYEVTYLTDGPRTANVTPAPCVISWWMRKLPPPASRQQQLRPLRRHCCRH